MWGENVDSSEKNIRELYAIKVDAKTNDTNTNVGLMSKRIGTITEKIYYYPANITDAQTLCGKDCDYYLWRPNQKGEQAITSITGLQQILNSLISNSGVSLSYVDGSLALRDASIAWLISRNYLKESSINLDTSSGFAWGLNGLLYIDVSVVAGGVSKVYVDDSLFLRDASIAWLDANKQPIGIYIRESSIGTGTNIAAAELKAPRYK